MLLLSLIVLAIYNNDSNEFEIEIPCETNLSKGILEESLELGTQFILNNQKSEGNFNYEYDWIEKELNTQDSEVRQAGALWGLSLIYNNKPNLSLLPALYNAFNFFDNNSIESGNKKWIVYPNSSYGKTGTIALLSLAHIDLLRNSGHIDKDNKKNLESDLNKYLNFLVSLRKDNGQFYPYYYHDIGVGFGDYSPYFDGESLLALTKAAKYLNKNDLKDLIKESAEAMYDKNIIEALEKEPDSSITKGFFQWGCMSYFELYKSGWNDTEKYSYIVINLADWMIDVHKTLDRTRNTAYAYEGIIPAYELAKLNNDINHTIKFRCVIEEGLYKLISWQVGGPIPNDFLKNHTTDDKMAIGGVMNHRSEPPLRIDVTQHQMHAIILALRYVYN